MVLGAIVVIASIFRGTAFVESPATGFLRRPLGQPKAITFMERKSTNFDDSVLTGSRGDGTGNGNGNGSGNGHLGTELADMVAELDSDPNVSRRLGSLPAFRSPRVYGQDFIESRERVPASVSSSEVAQVVYRDKDDVTTILNLTRLVMLLAMILMASAAANIFQYYRRPDRIIVDGPSGRVMSINDRNYGKEEGVEFGPDRLTAQDKLYVTREFVRYLYQVDPATRPRDVEKALRLMVPDSAVKFSNWLKERGILDQQKAESWQASWSPMDISVDPNSPYTVNVIGKQEINKLVSGAAVKEAKQLRITIRLMADPKGRDDRNLRSGFLISFIDAHELNDVPSQQGSDSQTAKPVTPVSALQEQP